MNSHIHNTRVLIKMSAIAAKNDVIMSFWDTIIFQFRETVLFVFFQDNVLKNSAFLIWNMDVFKFIGVAIVVMIATAIRTDMMSVKPCQRSNILYARISHRKAALFAFHNWMFQDYFADSLKFRVSFCFFRFESVFNKSDGRIGTFERGEKNKQMQHNMLSK